MKRSLRGDLTNAGTWAAIWFAGAMLVGGVIGIVDPDSIDPGDTAGMAMVMGLMAVLSGAVFAALLRVADPRPVGPRMSKALACGFMATALVQTALLGHGDAGLMANLGMALVMCAFGVVVTVCWLALRRSQTTPR